ncbi:LysR family transcriptional regulator [Prosthecomicrobium sp. N25]|uniref:LysR family transcriptional regulator n=1 Tax=Prosthecomicrobium sp. N25 TaxID=3129254 RepID=UPI0030786D77
MSAHRVELRQLAHFVAACQYPTISETARALAITPSALSTSLRTLEAELKLGLFLRMGSHLAPLPAAFWLFRRATDVLRAEAALDRELGRADERTRRIEVRLDLSFTIGRISKAIHRAMAAMAEEEPGVRFRPVFLDEDAALPESPCDAAFDAATRVDVGYGSSQAGAEAGGLLHDDVWLSVGAGEPEPDDAGGPLFVLDMRPPLMAAIGAHAEAHGFAARLVYGAGRPSDLARLLGAAPHARFLMPRSMIADRLGLFRLRASPLVPALASPLTARVTGPAAAAGHRFLDHLGAALDGAEVNALFAPRLTARQIRYFNLVHHTGGVSAAGRMARVTQPSISSQIQRMEAALGRPLLDRRRDGATATEAGRRLFPLTAALEEALDGIVRRARDIAAHTQSAVSLGTLPSSGHDSALTARIAEALTAVRLAHPDWRLNVVEATNAALHESVRAGELNLALVGSVQPRMARILLGRSERLSLVANPALGLGARQAIPLAEACALPLVLGTRQLSIHRLFMDAAEARHLPVSTVMEVGSLPLAIAMVRRAPICTVLPLSSVEQDVRDGRLTATPIAEDLVPGKLAVIFSPERSLSVAERAIIAALVAAFGRTGD